MTQTGADLLESRYGRTHRRRFDRWIAWGAVAVLLAIGLWVLFFGTWRAGASISFRDIGYSVIDYRSVRVDFEVTAPAGSDVLCALESVSTSHAQVGWRVLELPASEQRIRHFSETLVTTGLATTGYVKNCWIV